METGFSIGLAKQFGGPARYDPDASIVATVRNARVTVLLLLIGFGAAAAFVPIGGAVIGSGQIGAESKVKTVAHPAGGTIAEILVHNGQHVRKGQVLMRLDGNVSGTDAEMSALSVDQLLAQKARLEAEQANADRIVFPESLARRKDAAAIRAMASERQIFATRRSEQFGQTAQLRARIDQYREQIEGYEAQTEALQAQLKLIEPELKAVRDLYGRQLVTITRLNQLERTAADLRGGIGALRAQSAAMQARILETREQLLHAAETWRSRAGDQLAQVNGQLNQQQSRTASAADLHERSTIRAPYDGVVEGLAFSTIGGVIRPAEAIMEIVPSQDRLIVEGAIGPDDIDQVFMDQSARVRITALNRSTTPELRAKVSYVGSNRVTEQAGVATRTYYPVRLTIAADDLAANRDLTLKAGMPVELYIETGSRSILSFVTKPLRDQFARAFRSD